MAIRKRKGFTLVELLVVISIIGMLMALLLPAVQAAREAGRKASCANNLYNISRAVLNYETAKQTLPGYANRVAVDRKSNGNFRVGTYALVIMPFMERKDLYDAWSTPNDLNATDADTVRIRESMTVKLDWGLCPSDSDRVDLGGTLSYVCNAGEEYVSKPTTFLPGKHGAAGGVFHDFTDPSQSRISMDYVTTKDGSSTTLMLSENLQAGSWIVDPVLFPKINPVAADVDKISELCKAQSTFVWWVDVQVSSGTPITGTLNGTLPPDEANGINGDKYGEPDHANTDTRISMKYARPSAEHPGGTNYAFCDGHTRFIREDIDYKVYIQLMTPHGKGIEPGTNDALDLNEVIIDENDL